MTNLHRVIAILLPLLLITSTISVCGAETFELIKNGDFEVINADGSATDWLLNPADFCKITDDSHSGKSGMKLEGGTSYISQNVLNLVGGTAYTLTAWVKPVINAGAGAAIKIEFYNQESGGTPEHLSGTDLAKELKETTKTGEWNEVKIEFTAPEKATRLGILFRMFGNGECIWDDISLIGQTKNNKAAVTSNPGGGTVAPTVVLSQENVEHIINGNFESITQNAADNWTIAPDAQTCAPTTSDKHEGKYSMLQKTSSGFMAQDIRTIAAGQDYTVSAYIKPSSSTVTPTIKLEYYTSGGYLSELTESFKITDKVGQWQQITLNLTLPAAVTRLNILLRAFGSGEVYWDEVSMVGKALDTKAATPITLMSVESLPDPVPIELLPPYNGAPELIVNGSFESVEANGVPTGWSMFNKTDSEGKPYASITNEKAHTGSNSFKVETPILNLPWVCYLIKDIEEGSVYQASMWIYNTEVKTSGVGFKYEYYDINQVTAGHSVSVESGVFEGGVSNSDFYKLAANDWQQYTQTITVPKGAKALALYVRSYSKGTVYFDDVSCYKVGDPNKISVSTDDVFYYSDVDHGTATVTANSYFYPEITDKTVGIRLMHGTEVIKEQYPSAFVDGVKKFSFDMDWLSIKKDKYEIEATVYNQDGTVFAVETQEVYKYDRPTNLGADGVVTKNGKRIENPVFSYGAWDMTNTFPVLNQMGVNVIQGGVTKEKLDAAQANGLMVLGVLYNNVLPAGDPSNKDLTIKLVKQFKDHPALLGWMVMDEYHYHCPSSYDRLRDSYMIIREYDSDNPVFVMESFGGEAESAKYTDILGYDPYPMSKYPVASHIARFTDTATKKVLYRKPVWCLNQTFEYNGFYPTMTDARSMWYQALFKGADALGHYKFEGTRSGVNLNQTELWEGFLSLAEKELSESFNHFAYRKYPVFKEAENEDIWYSMYVKDGALYAVILNTNDQAKTFSIDLISDCKKVTVGAFTAQLIAGQGAATLSGNGVLSADITTNDVLVYKITPSTPVDFSPLKTTKFRDLITHPWAAPQIRELESKNIISGISHNFFGPSINITRADFAYFLIRTLGLTSDSTDNFSDIDTTAYYAKEIATGKALGILKGVGNNTFNPFEEISRQDLMVICARGMRLKKNLEEGNLSGFTDENLISDYAVTDIAAMVRANIVKGYEDGSINPLGNTTRAEAAVIMSRISEWCENP